MRNKGLGFVYQPKFTDRKTGELRTSPTYWISFSHRGTRHRISSGSDKRADAVRLLRQKLAAIGAGKPVGNEVDRTDLADLERMLTDNYVKKGNKSIVNLPGRFRHITQFFGGDCKAHEITSDRIDAFMAHRLESAARSTVNIEVTLLKRAFRLAKRAGRVDAVPEIELHDPRNARKGFFETAQLEAVMRYLPDDLKAPIRVAFLTGWRIKSEILTRKRSHLDLDAGWLRLEPNETKNGEGRNFPLTQELRAVLEEQVERTRALERETNQIIPWLFHRSGERIRDYRRPWRKACRLAGVPGRRPHDFRRTAARNFERLGVSRSAAMKLIGHRSEAMYRRYAIADEVTLLEAAAKIDAGQTSTERTLTLVKAESKLGLRPRTEDKKHAHS